MPETVRSGSKINSIDWSAKCALSINSKYSTIDWNIKVTNGLNSATPQESWFASPRCRVDRHIRELDLAGTAEHHGDKERDEGGGLVDGPVSDFTQVIGRRILWAVRRSNLHGWTTFHTSQLPSRDVIQPKLIKVFVQ